MSTKYATTVYNRRNRVLAHIADVYGRAVAFKFTAEKLNAAVLEVWQSTDYKKLPAYERGYVHGIEEGRNHDIWNNRVAWCLGPASGPTRRALTEWTEEMSTLCRLPGQLYGGHFWLDDHGEPTDKPFTEYKTTNAERTV